MYNDNISKIVNSPAEEIKEVQSEVAMVEEAEANAVEQETKEIKIGVVTDCLSLNIRKEPKSDAEVLCSIPCLTEVTIEENESTDEFYKICTGSGIEGFCMKKYIAVQQ